MLGYNDTPFAAIGFEQRHRNGDPMAVVAVRGSYELSPDGSLALATKQGLVLSDTYQGDPFTTPLVRVSDLIPFKPATDITIIGSTYAPNNAATSWDFGIGVDNAWHMLRCHGERHWQCLNASRVRAAFAVGAGHGQPRHVGLSRWQLSKPLLASEIALDYALAAGGEILGAPRYQVDLNNPRGRGRLHAHYVPMDEPIAAPLIESKDEPLVDPYAVPDAKGTAPVPPEWRWRHRFAGTYDEVWKRERAPLLPKDFDYRFYQSAHPDLIWDGYLRGDEQITLMNLTPGMEHVRFRLNTIVPVANFQWLDGREVTARLRLDGLHLDLRGDAPWRVDLTWRTWVAICPRYFKVDLRLESLNSSLLGDLPVAGEFGLQPDGVEPERTPA